ncbi:MAG: indolepyruvate ferredoxin oxidoreductase family protein, partial [Proteobacteria bacterium]|nr:indolepyruvate ferredoxin oxidoreductase family protein [Pseudomonadota bacterium]
MTLSFDPHYKLEHRYTRESGRVYITGVQALVRLPMLQHQRDRAEGLDTAGFISGYRGSPLGTYDIALWQAKSLLEANQIHFEPGVNEDLAATAVWGSQQANLMAGPRHDGVFGIWYGKGPGVDRSCDALKHANYAGTAPHGGVLALCGDDPGARSSSIAHQSEPALIHCGIPILNPSNVQEYLDLGLQGFALSRFSGCWVGFKCLTDTVDSAASVEVGPDRVRIVTPDDFTPPEGGLHIGWGNLPLEVERRLFRQRLVAAQAFVRANGLDRVVLDGPSRRLGIVTTGKAYLDVRQALEEIGIDEERAAAIGLSVYKVAMTWPLEPQGALAFARGLEDVLVVEEKRAIVEDQLARLLYNEPQATRPRLLGKTDETGRPLVASEGELAPLDVAEVLRSWLGRRVPDFASIAVPPVSVEAAASAASTLTRLPAFCSGCPHNTSTVVPEGSVALGGIGCHGMAVWLPERRTLAVTQMGGEGANWIGQAPFTETPHIFQNLGDGTYFHSGLLAIRAAVTAGVNITYKILANGAVAMTGGQPIDGEVLEGEVTVPEIARQLAAEGVRRIAVVGDEPDRYPADADFPRGATFHHRDELDRVQRELREVPGVSALIYDQTCAAEARRLRKRGAFPDPDQRVWINELVCEGCGDCSVQSNCISIEPVETEFGRKRRINQSSCNKDFSCLKGYCPSFLIIRGGRPRVSAGTDSGGDDRFANLPLPPQPPTVANRPFDVLVTGIGGSGVVTVGAILAVAAHLEGKACSELDVTGLAQKNGPVTSHIRIADDPGRLHATRIAAGAADLVLGCDIVVATGFDSLSRMSKGRTTAVVNTFVAPTSDFATNPDLDLSSQAMEDAIRQVSGEDGAHFLPATRLATALLGDAITTNLFLAGYAFQLGRLPLGLGAIERAIELNGRAVELNRRAFAWGRLAAHDLAAVEEAAGTGLHVSTVASAESSVDELVTRRSAFLTEYQNAAYARRYRARVERVATAERAAGVEGSELARAVAHAYFKVLSYKDEYEVARLWTQEDVRRQLEAEFEGDYRVEIQLAPPHLPLLDLVLRRRDPDTGRARKLSFGGWAFPFLRVLARLKFLRGTPFDPFGRAEHRRFERRAIEEYESLLDELAQGLSVASHDLAVELAGLPEHV